MKKHSIQVTAKSIESSGLPKDFKAAIAEYIWNGFDAKATEIKIDYSANDLGYLSNFTITDNGEGINLENIDQTFGYFLDSQKSTSFVNEEFVKGKKGKGRFAFGLFANTARWKTAYLTQRQEVCQYEISIKKGDQNNFEVKNEQIVENKALGTTVKFENIFDLTGDILEHESFEKYLCSEFGWFLFLNKDKSYTIKINGVALDYEQIIEDHYVSTIEIGDYSFVVSYIRWNTKIGDKYYFYMLNDSKKEVYRKHTGFNRKAIGFHHSVYVESGFFNDFCVTETDQPVLGLSGKNQADDHYKDLMKQLQELLSKKEKEFIRLHKAENLIIGYRKNKVIPEFKSNVYDQRRKEDLENVIKELYCVQPKIFQDLKKEQSKTIVGFLNLILDTDERENLLSIIENVIQLSDEEREELAKTLKKTKLSNITKTIKLLEDRARVVAVLKMLVFDLEKFTNERDHIQKAIENNYWLFGEQFHLISADENFEILLNNYLYFLENDQKSEKISDEERMRRPDIFLCRKHNVPDTESNEYNLEENVIVELKRPEVIIGKKQFNQIEDYARFIINEPRFNSKLRRWKFFIIGKKMDSFIEDKYESQKMKGKKFLVESVRNYEIYAMTWDDVFKNFELKHSYLIDKLDLKDAIKAELAEKGILFDRSLSNKLSQDIIDNTNKN
ncbi:ATP-binding protein [Marinifilum fragile]|uniref:ATP-binding protein n=1 Tax=Marinifilum fragile TaxID=570161 RepID=UPI002AAB1FED|nr:ATP-binding protein [Marinifilum fragile]